MVHEIKPFIGLHAVSMEPAWGSVFFLCLNPALSLSLKKNNNFEDSKEILLCVLYLLIVIILEIKTEQL